MDANFKLKGKDRGIKDPELAPGWVSFVEETRFQKHIKNSVEQPEVRFTYHIRYDVLNDFKTDKYMSFRA
jgi:hypothetical protein